MNTLFYFLLAICLVCHIIRSIYSLLKQKNKIASDNKFIYILMFITMFALWLSWFQLSEIDPYRGSFPVWLQYTGFVLFLTGTALFIIPLIQLRGLENIDHLITTGIFSFLRHPMYLGMILWVIGYPLFLEATATLLTSPLWIVNILFWRHLEEQELIKKYSEYAEYIKKTIF